jgi:hypothetical protein
VPGLPQPPLPAFRHSAGSVCVKAALPARDFCCLAGGPAGPLDRAVQNTRQKTAQVEAVLALVAEPADYTPIPACALARPRTLHRAKLHPADSRQRAADDPVKPSLAVRRVAERAQELHSRQRKEEDKTQKREDPSQGELRSEDDQLSAPSD